MVGAAALTAAAAVPSVVNVTEAAAVSGRNTWPWLYPIATPAQGAGWIPLDRKLMSRKAYEVEGGSQWNNLSS